MATGPSQLDDDQVHPSYYDTAFSASTLPIHETLFDTGSTAHMFKDKSLLDCPIEISPTKISVASEDGEIWATHRGSVDIGLVRLSNVLYSKKLTSNLISVGRLCDSGFKAVFTKNDGCIKDSSGRVLIRMSRNPRHSRLGHPVIPDHEQAAFTSDRNSTLARLWHLRLGHSHPDAVIEVLKSQFGNHLSRKDFIACDECSQGKSSQTPATNPLYRSPSVLDVVHSDIIGPIHPPTVNGNKYILTFIDDHTRFNAIYLFRNKSEAFEKFKHFKAKFERQTGKKVGKLKTDRGGEYTSRDFTNFLTSHGIESEKGPAKRPTTNSVAERFGRTLINRIRTQLLQCGLPLSLWGELAMYSSLQINCCPSKAIANQIPLLAYHTLCSGHMHPFDFNRLKPFGCLVFAHQQNRSSKLTPTSKRMIFVGLEDNARAARLWDKSTGRILVTGDVIYRENIFPGLT